MDAHPIQAMIRFGLGRRGDQALPANPAAWLQKQLRDADPALSDPISTTLAALDAHRLEHELKREGMPINGQTPPTQALWKADTGIAMRRLAETDRPFRERLVWFWANHFTVSLRRGEIRPLALPYVSGSDPPACHRPLRRHACAPSSAIRRCCGISTTTNPPARTVKPACAPIAV